MGLFNKRKLIHSKVPIWFMRQAGRYHSHYQNIKKNSHFLEMCKTPKLACEITMGPIQDFNFDAAILFSDLLFPLEHLGMDLVYNPGPQLGYKLSHETLEKLKPSLGASDFFNFQKLALQELKLVLPEEKTLLGFVGAPFTLYTYATEGSHAGALFKAKRGLYDGLYDQFVERLYPHLLTEMLVQAEGGADAVCIFDTAVGELTLKDFKKFNLKYLKRLTADFKKKYPDVQILYYSRNTHLHYLREIQDDNIDALGIDWRVSLVDTLSELSNDYYIQGNFDPCWLHLSKKDCLANLEDFISQVPDKYYEKWIFGLGHGVLIETPEENVRAVVDFVHEKLS